MKAEGRGMRRNLELIARSNIVAESRLIKIASEVNELTAIFVTCAKNAKNRSRGDAKPRSQ